VRVDLRRTRWSLIFAALEQQDRLNYLAQSTAAFLGPHTKAGAGQIGGKGGADRSGPRIRPPPCESKEEKP
jgi:hypothetical protein